MSAYRILYLAGIGRNGGTLLDRILGHVPGFVSTGELRYVWRKGVLDDELCNCGERFGACPYWRAVGQRAFRGFDGEHAARMHGLSEDSDPSRHVLDWRLRRPAFLARMAPYTQALARLHDAVAAESGARVVVNSSKFAGYGFALVESGAAPIHVLHLVRDPRATAWSWSKKVRKPEVAGGGDAFLKQHGAVSAALQWDYRNVCAELLKERAVDYRLLRYEDFAASPRSVTASIVRWVGMDDRSLPFTEDRAVELGVTHTQSGNPSRFRMGRVEVRPDEEWRERMPAARRGLVSVLTLPFARRYGY